MFTKYDIKISLIGPAYNEEESVEWAVRKWVKDLSELVTDFEIVLVDDGSIDKTWEIVAKLAKDYPQLRPIRHEVNQGAGAATLTGISAARKDYLFWNPVDMPFDTKNLPVLLDKLEEADIVIGYRKDRKANSFYRKITSIVNYLLIRTLSRMPVKDFQFVQIYPRELFDKIVIKSRSTFLPPEVIIKAHKAGYSWTQVEVNFDRRKFGSPKCGSLKVILRSIHEILKFFFWENRRK